MIGYPSSPSSSPPSSPSLLLILLLVPCVWLVTLPQVVIGASFFGCPSTGRFYRTAAVMNPIFASSAEENLSVDLVAQLPLLKARLQETSISASTDDAQEQQELQWQIDQAETAAELGVRKVQMEFYDAFSTQDLQKMNDLWATDGECIHPGMTSIQGKVNVLKSWEMIFQQGNAFRIEPRNTQLEICGTTAICRCVETIGNESRLEALNIYRREDGKWKLTLHMACPIMMGSGMPP